jgi:hypothetical protein
MTKEQKMDSKTGLMNPKPGKAGKAFFKKTAVTKAKKSDRGHTTVNKGNR